jgi:hypothetical protein
MARPSIQIHDAATGETIVREMNDDEFVQFQADAEQALAERAAEEAAIAAQEASRASAIEKLAALGLTESEVAAIIP